VGCNNSCTFCIVPTLRGVEKDRSQEDILREIHTLVDQGVIEITLLGQNVNAYGFNFGEREAFAALLRECGKIEGLERVRFMSPHPRDFTDEVIAAMAQTPNAMPHLHMPLQSGSDRILQSMRRSYRSEKYLGILDRVRQSIPKASITTDIIVGFPGESEEDFQATLDLCTAARFTAAYTYKYSKRPGTPAAQMPDQVPEDVVGERYTRLHKHQEAISLSVNQELVGQEREVLVMAGEGRRDEVNSRTSGRSEDFRTVHIAADQELRPGDVVRVKITEASSHYLLGDAIEIRATRGGDAHQLRHAEVSIPGVLLGMPSTRK
jgi:tRNA-2-methylthio-N6-dimethylallyladenosine synthase